MEGVCNELSEIDSLISSISLEVPGLQKGLLVLHNKVFSLRAAYLGLVYTPKLANIAVYLLDRVKQTLLSVSLKPAAKPTKSASSSCFGPRPDLNKRLQDALRALDDVALALRSEDLKRIGATQSLGEEQMLSSRFRRGHIRRSKIHLSSEPESKHREIRKQMHRTVPPPAFFPELDHSHPVMRFLTNSQGLCLVGIVGQAGVGKTTLLVHILQMLQSIQSFSFITYVELVGDRPDKEALLRAQASMLLQLGGPVGKFKSLSDGRLALRERFQDLAATGKSIYIAIDNVWRAQDLKDLLSDVMLTTSVTLQTSICVIATSRMHNIIDAMKEVWTRPSLAKIFEQKAMLLSAARDLLLAQFNLTSAGADTSENGLKMVDDICAYCGRLPLALKAAGRSLLAHAEFAKSDNWAECRKMMCTELRAILETSFKNLQGSSLGALCDIASFLHGWEWDIVQIIVGVEEMNELSNLHLIECVHQKKPGTLERLPADYVTHKESGIVVMHDFMRKLALENSDKPWDPEVSLTSHLWDATFLNAVRYLRLNEGDFKLQMDVPMGGRCFALMGRLRVLELYGSFKCSELLLPDTLLCLRLGNNNVLKLLSDVQLPSNLGHFELECNLGLLELPLSIYDCTNLQSMRICSCPNLHGFRSLSNWKSLKKLHLASCHGITQLPADLEDLELLTLHGCKNLQKLPRLPSRKTILDIQACPHLVTAGSQMVRTALTVQDSMKSPLQLEEPGHEMRTQSGLEDMPLHRCGKIQKLSAALTQLRLQDCTCRKLEGLEALKNLTKLKLEFCQNLIELPDSVCTLESLVVLHLRGCSQVEQLPMEIGNLNSLESLDLRDCKKLKRLPKSISFLKLLKELNLSGCFELEVLPEEIGSLSSLRVMRLAKCKRLAALPISICDLNSLSQLDLHGCEKLKELPKKIGDLRSFETLCLRECHDIRVLPDSICKITSLVVLHMNECSHLQELPEDMGSLGNLKVLNLAECSSLARLCDSISNLDSLVMLDLQGCLKLENLPQEFGKNLRSLETLFLMECPGLKSLPNSFCRLETLKELDLSGCLKLEKLPENMGNLSSLQKLRLANCEVLKRLPDSVCQLQSLVMLDLHGCYMMEELPMEFGKLSTLETLNLVKCRSLKLLPQSFHGLLSLREIDMRGSQQAEKGQLYFVGCNKVKSFLKSWSGSIDLNTAADVAQYSGLEGGFFRVMQKGLIKD